MSPDVQPVALEGVIIHDLADLQELLDQIGELSSSKLTVH